MKTFEQIYQEMITDKTDTLNISWLEAKNERKKANSIFLGICIIIDIVILIMFILPDLRFIKASTFNIISILPRLIVIFVVDMFIYVFVNLFFSKKQNKYKQIYKSTIIKKLMENFYTNLEYYQAKQMPKYIYDEGKYGEYYNRYNSEDYLEAQLNNKYGIQMGEVTTKKVETHRDSKGRTRTTTRIIFHGLFAKIVMDKTINSKLRIAQNGRAFLSSEQLKMDSSEFEKYFDVQASDKIIGMQLLTSDIMQDLIEFQNKTNVKYDIFIDNNTLYLRFHSR